MDETDRHDVPAETWLKEQQDVELKHCQSANKATGLPEQREKWGNLAQSMRFRGTNTNIRNSFDCCCEFAL